MTTRILDEALPKLICISEECMQNMHVQDFDFLLDEDTHKVDGKLGLLPCIFQLPHHPQEGQCGDLHPWFLQGPRGGGATGMQILVISKLDGSGYRI